MIQTLRTFWMLVATASLTGACSNSDPSAAPGADAAADANDGPILECARHTIANSDTFAEGLTKLGEGGLMKLKFAHAEPLIPAKGHDVWTIQVTDAGGQPINGGQITFDGTPFMPCHNHATSVFPTATPAGTDGTYTIDPVYFTMTGIWTVTFAIKSADAKEDRVLFQFVIPR
jgi:hypothetical protein